MDRRSEEGALQRAWRRAGRCLVGSLIVAGL